MLNNRVLRQIQNLKEFLYLSFFITFDRKLGITDITMDEIGNIYIAKMMF